MTWEDLAAWWREQLGSDPNYEAEVTPLVAELLGDPAGLRVLDVGCGEGRLMGWLVASHARAFGVDVSRELLMSARLFGPVVQARLPSLGPLASGSFDAAVVSLVLEHLEDEWTLFAELGRVVRPGGSLALVINHPIYTAPRSAPIQEDDEVLWRPGTYFGRGHTDEPAGERKVRFHHRTMADLLNAASTGGWDLDRMVEVGATDTQVAAHPPLAAQRHIPRLLGCRWVRRPPSS